MGCWTTYCSFCGGPPDFFHTFDDYLKIIKSRIGVRKFKKESEEYYQEWKDIYQKQILF